MIAPLNGDAIALLLLAWLALGVLAMLVCGAVAYRIGKPTTKPQAPRNLRVAPDAPKKLTLRELRRFQNRKVR